MDMNDMLKLLMTKEVLGQVSEQTGISSNDAAVVMAEILPMLLKGMQGQATDSSTSAGFLDALQSHSKDDTSDVKVAVKKVDTEDGAKIVDHLLGSKTEEAAAKAKKKSGIDTKTILKIMAIVAPILMAQLGKSAQKQQKEAAGGGSVVGNILGNIDAGDVVKIISILMK